MIVVYPMLTSKSVSTNIIPGICKALEKFVLVYDIDHVAKTAGITGKILKVGITAAKLAAEQKKYVLEATPEITRKGTKENPIDPKQKEDKSVKDLLKEIETMMKTGKVSIEAPEFKDKISLEPTWITIDTSTGTKVLGIKVIPYPVISDIELARMMLVDSSLPFFEKIMYGFTRKIIRVLYAFARGIMKKLPFVGASPLSGDPEKDIIFAASKYKGNVFALVNFADIKDDKLFKNAGGVGSLFKLGWNSFIAADDVGKKVTFCMKQFGGLCTTMPYGYLYASGKEQMQVYKSLEDLQKVTTPFFSSKVSSTRIFGESLYNDKMTKYSKISECESCIDLQLED